MYAGTGTIGILLSPYFATVHSVELVPSASADGSRNAIANNVHNIEFVCTRAEDFAKKYVENGHTADTVVIDPPRDGMHPSTLPCILSLGAREIVYVSCNPSTLVRDLHTLLRVPPRTESVQGADSSIQIADT
jgi:23S rRNA (uracil1939-C5)-methyltransferase